MELKKEIMEIKWEIRATTMILNAAVTRLQRVNESLLRLEDTVPTQETNASTTSIMTKPAEVHVGALYSDKLKMNLNSEFIFKENKIQTMYFKSSLRRNKSQSAHHKYHLKTAPVISEKAVKLIIQEKFCHVLDAPNGFARAHAVDKTLHMRAGIALDFRHEIGQVNVLISQPKGVVEVATVLDAKQNRIFYMIAKERRFHKPRKPFEKSFKNNYLRALKGLKQACIDYKINKLAIPRLGCNLDMLSWSEFIKPAILDIFGDLDMHILVCTSMPGIQRNKPSRVQFHQSSTSSQSKEALSMSSLTKVPASHGDTSQQCPSTAAPSVVELPAIDVSPTPLNPGEHGPRPPTGHVQGPPVEEVLDLSRGPDSKAERAVSASMYEASSNQSNVPASPGATSQQCPSTAAPSVVELPAIDVSPAPQHPGEHVPHIPTVNAQIPSAEEVLALSRGLDRVAELTTCASIYEETNNQSKVPDSHGGTLQQCPSTASPSVVELLAIDVSLVPQHPAELGPRPPSIYVQCHPAEEGSDLSREPERIAERTMSANRSEASSNQSKVPASHGDTSQQCPSTAVPSVVELPAIDVSPAPQHPGELGPRPHACHVQSSSAEALVVLNRKTSVSGNVSPTTPVMPPEEKQMVTRQSLLRPCKKTGSRKGQIVPNSDDPPEDSLAPRSLFNEVN
jgi:hypothetical protein